MWKSYWSNKSLQEKFSSPQWQPPLAKADKVGSSFLLHPLLAPHFLPFAALVCLHTSAEPRPVASRRDAHGRSSSAVSAASRSSARSLARGASQRLPSRQPKLVVWRYYRTSVVTPAAGRNASVDRVGPTREARDISAPKTP